MLEVNISFGKARKILFTFDERTTASQVEEKIAELTGIAPGDFYILQNGRLAQNSKILDNGVAEIVPRLPGGKGGFGSMLRAIGAQIEKTTNREACRDLSGRRLRDINEEKRLKSWIDKQATREEEAVERKKKKLERLCAQPKHEFKDKNYEKERSTLTEKVGDAVEEGFRLAMAGGSGEKRKAKDDKAKGGRKRLALDLDIDSDEIGSSSDESDSDSQSGKKGESSSSSHSCQDKGEIKSRDVEREEKIQTASRNFGGLDSGSKTSGDEDNSDNNSVGVKESVEKVAVVL